MIEIQRRQLEKELSEHSREREAEASKMDQIEEN